MKSVFTLLLLLSTSVFAQNVNLNWQVFDAELIDESKQTYRVIFENIYTLEYRVGNATKYATPPKDQNTTCYEYINEDECIYFCLTSKNKASTQKQCTGSGYVEHIDAESGDRYCYKCVNGTLKQVKCRQQEVSERTGSDYRE